MKALRLMGPVVGTMLMAVVLGGCGTTPSATSSPTSSATQSSGPSSGPSPIRPAGLALGSPQPIAGPGGVAVQLTVTQVTPHATVGPSIPPAPSGQSWFAVAISADNSGTAEFRPHAATTMTIQTATGQRISAAHVLKGTLDGGELPDTGGILAGSQVTGYVLFAVPVNASPSTLTFAPGSGWTPPSATWVLTP